MCNAARWSFPLIPRVALARTVACKEKKRRSRPRLPAAARSPPGPKQDAAQRRALAGGQGINAGSGEPAVPGCSATLEYQALQSWARSTCCGRELDWRSDEIDAA